MGVEAPYKKKRSGLGTDETSKVQCLFTAKTGAREIRVLYS